MAKIKQTPKRAKVSAPPSNYMWYCFADFENNHGYKKHKAYALKNM